MIDVLKIKIIQYGRENGFIVLHDTYYNSGIIL